jgi:preprotein translocase subunit SecA
MMVSEPQEAIRNSQNSYRQYVLNYDLLINHQRQTIYKYRQRILASPNIFAIVLPEKAIKNPQPQPYLKSQLVREIDFAWANYLEGLEKVRNLVNVRS